MSQQNRISNTRIFRIGIIASVIGLVGVLFSIENNAHAKQGVVKTRDGRTIEGDVVEKDDEVIITLRGIPTRIARESVENIQYTGSIEEQYNKKLKEFPNKLTAANHLDLAKWLFDQKAYELAKKEADTALTMDPTNSEAQTLLATVQSQIRLEQFKPSPEASGTKPPVKPVSPNAKPTETNAAETRPNNGLNASLKKYLSAANINSLKQAEWPGNDNSVRVTISQEAKRKYLVSAKEKGEDLSSLSPVEFARDVMGKGTAEERAEVKILNDPAPLMEYRKLVQPLILSHCATAGCHGGGMGGNLFLYSNAGSPESDAPAYTNFYLLTQSSATVEGKKRMMIDRTYPDQSLIALFGLPLEVSKVAHPEVKGQVLKPIFRGKNDPQYKAVIAWIEKLVNPEPKYDFTFYLIDPPATAPTTAPTTTPPAKSPVTPAK